MIFKRGTRLPAFTITEVLVALSVIAIAATSIITILSHATKFMRYDTKLQQATQVCDEYLTSLYLATNLGQALFTPQETSNLQYARQFPLLLPPQRIQTKEGMLLLVNKKIRRIDPLLVDIGLEVLWKVNSSNQKSRHLWVETSLSEKYLQSMK